MRTPDNLVLYSSMMRRTILFVFSESNQIIDTKFAGVHDFARQRNWNLRRTTNCQLPLKTLIDCWNPDGIITDSTMFAKPDRPCVLIDGDARPDDFTFPRVDVNLAESAKLAGAEFLRLGLTSVAWLPPAEEHPWSDKRRDSFLSFVRAHGMTVSIFPKRAQAERENLAYLKRLSEWATSLPHPCGVFAANDKVAELFLSVCSMNRIKVPNDLAVIGVDDLPLFCDATTPTLTSITPAFRESGFAAAEMMDELLKGRRPADRTLGSSGISHRESTRRIYGKQTDIRLARDLIRREACSGLKPRDVFAVMNGSVRNAQIRFRAETGKTVRDEIEHIRMEKARRLLRTTDKPISEIAELCGYATDSFLCDAFKRTAGCTMGTWRKAHSREAE